MSKIKEYMKNWRLKNRDKIKEYMKKYRRNNKEKISKTTKIYYQNHINQIRNWKKKYIFQKRKKNLFFKILTNLRTRINQALNRNSKKGYTLELLGCSIKQLKEHLQKQFKKGMTWKNWGIRKGNWHIDHIRPCRSFNLQKKSEQKKCFNWQNLQPLWLEENHKKKITDRLLW